MGMILRIASSRIVGQGDIVGRSGYFSLNLSANSVMRGRLDARRTLKSLVADLRAKKRLPDSLDSHMSLFRAKCWRCCSTARAGTDRSAWYTSPCSRKCFSRTDRFILIIVVILANAGNTSGYVKTSLKVAR